MTNNLEKIDLMKLEQRAEPSRQTEEDYINEAVPAKKWPNGMYLVKERPRYLQPKLDIRDQPLEDLLRRKS